MRLVPRSRTGRILFWLFLIACLTIAVDLAWVWHWKQIVIAHDTTRITAPLNTHRYPDYLAALNTQLIVPNDNNAAPLLLQIVGTTQTNPAWQAATHKLLDLSPDPLPPQMVALYQFRQKATGKSLLDKDDWEAICRDEETAMTAPWSRQANPELAQWIDCNTHALDLLHTAVTRPRYYVPLLTRDGQPANLGEQFIYELVMPQLAKYKGLADISIARAMSRLDAGDFDGFRHDLLTNARLSRLLTQSATLIEYLVALAIDSRVFTTAQAAAISGKFDAAQIAVLLRDLEQLPPFPSPAAQIDTGDRYASLDSICKFTHVIPFGANRATYVPTNFNALLRTANAFNDDTLEALTKPTFTQRQLAFEQIAENYTRIFNQTRSAFAQSILSLVFIVFDGTYKADILHTRLLANRNLALTALSLRAYKLQNAHYPDALTDLPATAYLQDPFTNTPLIYRRQGEGYLLYSLDENQQDDNGTPKSKTNPKNFDLPLEAAQ